MLPIASHLPLDFAGHALLDHESVHVNVGLEAATISWIGKTVILEVFLELEGLLLLDEHLVVALDAASFQIEFLLDGIDSRIVLLQQHVQLVHVHLTHSTIIVRDVGVNGALGAWDGLRGRTWTSLYLMLLAQFLKLIHCLAL